LRDSRVDRTGTGEIEPEIEPEVASMEPGRERWEILPIVTHTTAVLFPGVRCEAVVATVEALGAIREGLMSWGRPDG
jgi:hypothetical protein